jgi:glycosyltransferase involved in cell wall biosynthesis
MKPRILIVSHSGGLYGAERSLLALIEGLDKDRFEIEVAIPEPGPMETRLKSMDISWGYLPTCPIIMGEFRLIRSLIQLPKQLYNVIKAFVYIKKRNINLVHCNSIVTIESAFAAKFLKIPTVIHCRELLKNCPYGFFLGWKVAYRLIYYLSDKVICISNSVKKEIREAIPNDKKTVKIYNTFELPHISFKEDNQKTNQKHFSVSRHIIGCIAGIHPRKGHFTLIKAFSIVKKSIPDSYLMLIGGGKSRFVTKVKKLAAKYDILNSIEFIGKVQDPSPYYRMFSVLAVPSVAEAFGLVYAEAGMFELPAIGTSDGAAKEIIQDGLTGYVIPPEAPDMLAKSILKILKNPKLANDMGNRAKERIETLFPLKNYITGVEQVYDDLLKRRD